MMTQAAQHFNWIDYTILALVGLSAVVSFFRGFVREAISMTAWILGFYLALKFATHLQSYFQQWITSATLCYFIGFVVIFLAVVIVGLLINLAVGLLLKSTGISLVDRFVGIIFGTLRGMAVVAVLLLLFTNLGTMKDSLALSHSKLAKEFKPIVLWMDGFLPAEMKQMTEWVMNDFKNHHETKR